MKAKLEGSSQMFGVDLMSDMPYSYVLYKNERVLTHQFTMQNHGYRQGQNISKKSFRFIHIEFSSILETKKILLNIFKKKIQWQ